VLSLASRSTRCGSARRFGVFLGFALAKLWTLRVDYASNLLNWYQQASFLTCSRLRGVGTRLTMLLALIGGSLATARGRTSSSTW